MTKITEQAKQQMQADNDVIRARAKMIDDHIKLKNDVAEFTAITNQFLKSDSPTTRPILAAIVESEKFQSLVNQTK